MGADLAIFLYNPNTFQQWKSTTIIYLLLLPFLLNLGPSFSRELRPTQHGLPFQNSLSPQSLNNTSSSSPEMLSFFGYKYSDHNNHTKSDSPPDTAWWKQVSDGNGNNKTGKDERVRRGLMIATIVCGGIGIVLLISALLLFVFHFHRYRRSSTSSSTVTVTNRNLVGIGIAGPSTAVAASSTAATAAAGYHPISTTNK